MKYIVTAAQMKEYDSNTIEKIMIPGPVLMERAAMAVCEKVLKFKPENVLIAAGVGNNGGDGLALARLLKDKNIDVDILVVGDTTKATMQWELERKILGAYDIPFIDKMTRQYDVYVDAIFGVGLCRDIEGKYRDVIEEINSMTGVKIAVDIPSGVNADNGHIMGCAVNADVTVTFGFLKRGLYMFPGCETAGHIVLSDVGINERAFMGNPPDMFILDEEISGLMPRRDKSGNKGTFGKVLLIAGSEKMSGAAVLSARACYRAGAGMVKVISADENRVILAQAVPEALFGSFNDVKESMDWADVVAIGPGLSKSENAYKILKYVLSEGDAPLIIDADAINLISENDELKELVYVKSGEGRAIIMTPHIGELSRLINVPIGELKNALSEYARNAAKQSGAIIVAKDARTFICAKDKPTCMNIRGTNGMATAGSGDVLCGCIAGLLAQGTDAFEAACTGVYMHAIAGECAAEKMSDYSMTALDIAESLCEAIRPAAER